MAGQPAEDPDPTSSGTLNTFLGVEPSGYALPTIPPPPLPRANSLGPGWSGAGQPVGPLEEVGMGSSNARRKGKQVALSPVLEESGEKAGQGVHSPILQQTHQPPALF